MALAILLIVPERRHSQDTHAPTPIGAVYRDPRFWRLAPLSATTIGTAWAMQGLWAAPWLADVEGLHRSAVVTHLFLMALALSASALLLGIAADRLGRRGISPPVTLAIATGIALVAQLALVLRWPLPTWLPWVVIAATGAATVLSFATLSGLFPKSASGCANGALNVLHVTAAFAIQSAIGLVVQQWPAEDAQYPPEAYQAALSLNFVLQAAAFLWFIRPERKAALHHLPAHPIHALATSLGLAPAAALSYARARHAWSLQMARARAQEKAWRSVAFASFAVLALLASSLSSTILGTSVAAHVVEGPHAGETRDFADGRRQHFKHSGLPDRPEVLPASLAPSPLVRPDPRREPW